MFRTLATLFSFSTLSRSATIYPTLDLSTLDGVIGSEFNGVLSNDQSGSTVAGVGDINGDGLDDFAIAAINALNSAGQVSVIFGSSAGYNSAVDLSTSLNGTNGFVIAGESPNDSIGFSITSGDINGDGLSDFVVTAPFAAANGGGSGKVYVIYGTRAGFNATFPLAMLNNSIYGFVIYGVSGGDYTGYSVAMGDVNRDGFSDLLIGAPYVSTPAASGSTYLIYGSNHTFATPFQLSTLNGIKGSRFNGGVANYNSGYAVALGDFNGDGFSDLVIGAPANSQPNPGLTAVVFGTGIGFSATVNLSSALNGSNGFNLYGVANYDQTGISVAAGDVNNDGLSEILIGAANADPGGRYGAGVTYVLYGTSTPFNATFPLASLSGEAKGFKINGANLGDASGRCVAIAGDINGDGIKDFMIGAPSTTLNGVLQVGTTYIMLGIKGTPNTTVELSVPNSNCLILRAGAVNENSGFSVSGVGDVNGDGLSDVIIGAKGASPYERLNAGSSDLVYGDSIQLINNQLTISAEGSHILTLSDLNASVPFNPRYTQYTITGLQHGQFEYTDQPGVAIISFSAQDITAGRVTFIQDGNLLAPSCLVSAKHTFAATTPVAFNMTFIYEPPSVVYNNIPINQGETVLVLSSMFSATYPGNPGIDDEITYLITNCSYGAFSPPSSFTYPQVLGGGVNFVTFNSLNPPQCSFTISLRGAYVGPISVGFDFDTTPVLVQNHFDICQGQIKVVTPSMLSAIHPGANSSDTLVFSVNNVQYGYFERVNAQGVAILNFTQAEINGGSIQFAHDGSPLLPGFMVTVSDGRITTPLISAAPYFSYAPELPINALTLNQGQTVVLNSNMLNAVNPNLNSLSEDLVFTVSSVIGGAFIKVNTTQNITQFNQSQVTANEITFRSDGSPNAPSYDVVVANQCSQTQPSGANVKFNSAPQITVNELTITKQGQPVFVTTGQLDATDKETPADDLSFNVSVMQGGCFKSIGLQQCITLFPRQAVRVGTILFAQDSSGLRPEYNVSVTDGVLWDGPRQALVTLNTPSVTIVNTPANAAANYTGAIVGSVVGLAALALAALGINRCCNKKKANDQFNKMLLEQGTSAADQTFKQEVIYPIASKIFDVVDTTGFTGQRTAADTKAYMEAIVVIVAVLLSELKAKGINLDFKTMDPSEKETFFKKIADLTRQHSIPKHKRCSVGNCTRFFRAAATPQDLENAAKYIAEDAATWQNRRKRGPSTKNTSSGIELGVLISAGFSDEKAANNEDMPAGQQLTWARDMQQVQQRVTKLEEQVVELGRGQSPRRQSAAATR